jgi:cbb3-type cytochrome oxidase maturation protein
MNDSFTIITFTLMLMALLLGAGAFCLFVWAVRSGQMRDVEAVKYRMLDDDARGKE